MCPTWFINYNIFNIPMQDANNKKAEWGERKVEEEE